MYKIGFEAKIFYGAAGAKASTELKIKNLNELVEITGYHRSHIWRILQVANLAPAITEAIIDGNEPYGLSITKLKKPIPEIWEEQIAAYTKP